MKESDLQLSKVFLEALNGLPLEYNYPLYSRIFDDFGTHYYASGSLGGRYDLLYQYSAEELRNSGIWSLAKEDGAHYWASNYIGKGQVALPFHCAAL